MAFMSPTLSAYAPGMPFMSPTLGWRIGERTTEALRLVVARRLVSAYCAVQPPSITSSLPVTNDASSDAR